jgi:hypothetical protein
MRFARVEAENNSLDFKDHMTAREGLNDRRGIDA